MKRGTLVALASCWLACSPGTADDSDGNGRGGAGGDDSGGNGGGDDRSGGSRTGGRSGGSAGTTTGGSGGTTGGSAGTTMMGGSGGTMSAMPDFTKAPGCTMIEATIRDFDASHPDFQYPSTDLMVWPTGTTGVVEAMLGADKKPTLLPAGVGLMGIASSMESFKQWFNDAPGMNMTTKVNLAMKQINLTTFEFGPTNIDGHFFPIDNKLKGNKDFTDPAQAADAIEAAIDLEHNNLFTAEIHTEFLYQGGKEELLITHTDDDSWIFINGKLAIDDGGLNKAQQMLNLDAAAAQLGLEPGKRYPVDIFFADRQMVIAMMRIMGRNIIWTGCAPK